MILGELGVSRVSYASEEIMIKQRQKEEKKVCTERPSQGKPREPFLLLILQLIPLLNIFRGTFKCMYRPTLFLWDKRVFLEWISVEDLHASVFAHAYIRIYLYSTCIYILDYVSDHIYTYIYVSLSVCVSAD